MPKIVRIQTRIFRCCIPVIIAMLLSGRGSAADHAELAGAVDDAMRSWDVANALAVLSQVREERTTDHSPAMGLLQARAALAVAEMLRFEFEITAEQQRADRAELGQRIDAVAAEGLQILDTLQESCQKWRLEADLLATMIRSNYRAKKYEARLKAAIARALELDENNARAWTASAKPFLFADTRHGGDVEEAVRRLNRALDIDPNLESALVLRAYCFEKLGKIEQARRDRAAALRVNPECRPARFSETSHH